MTDFSESYANKLLKGIMRFSHEHEPWVVCKMPLSLRDNGRMDEVVKFRGGLECRCDHRPVSAH